MIDQPKTTQDQNNSLIFSTFFSQRATFLVHNGVDMMVSRPFTESTLNLDHPQAVSWNKISTP